MSGTTLDRSGVRTRSQHPDVVTIACVICSEPLYAQPVAVACTENHAMHEACLKRWKKRFSSTCEWPTCPVCRKPVRGKFRDAKEAPLQTVLRLQSCLEMSTASAAQDIAKYRRTAADEERLEARSLEMLTRPDVAFAKQEQLNNAREAELAQAQNDAMQEMLLFGTSDRMAVLLRRVLRGELTIADAEASVTETVHAAVDRCMAAKTTYDAFRASILEWELSHDHLKPEYRAQVITWLNAVRNRDKSISADTLKEAHTRGQLEALRTVAAASPLARVNLAAL